MSAPKFTKSHYEWVASVFAAFEIGKLERQPVLCQADDLTHQAWIDGERAAKRELVEAFAAKFSLDNPLFNAELFKKACQYRSES